MKLRDSRLCDTDFTHSSQATPLWQTTCKSAVAYTVIFELVATIITVHWVYWWLWFASTYFVWWCMVACCSIATLRHGVVTGVSYFDTIPWKISIFNATFDTMGKHWHWDHKFNFLLKDKYNKTTTWHPQIFFTWLMAQNSRTTVVNVNIKIEQESTACAVSILWKMNLNELKNQHLWQHLRLKYGRIWPPTYPLCSFYAVAYTNFH